MIGRIKARALMLMLGVKLLALWAFILLSATCGLLVFSLAAAQAGDTFTYHEQQQIDRLKAIGYGSDPELYLRLFKEEKILEIWVKTKALGGGTYKLFRSVDICKFSGEIGPKLSEGDKQSPEGFYHVPAKRLFWQSAKWPRALNLAFPNMFDALSRRSGSYVLIHGGCSSLGCFALENGPMEALYALVSLAVKGGQKLMPIHIFPFRLSETNLEKHKEHKWAGFWSGLRPVYDHFNSKRSLPGIYVCEGGYKIMPGHLFSQDLPFMRGKCLQPVPILSASEDGAVEGVEKLSWVAPLYEDYKNQKGKRIAEPAKGPRIKVKCNLKLASCKRWLALRKKMLKRGVLPRSLLSDAR